MKTDFITKLFYRKYPFKIVITNQWVTDMKFKDFGFFKDKVYNNKMNFRYYGPESIKEIKNNLTVIKSLFDFLTIPGVKTRYEHCSLSIFIDNKTLFNNMRKELEPIISSVSIPYSDKILQELLDNNKIEIRKNLIYDCRYKIILKNNGKGLRPEVKENFLNLTKRHKEQFVIPHNANYYLQKDVPSYYYLSNSFFYVKDSKMLTMTQMMLQPVIKEVISMFTYEEIENKDKSDEQI